MKKIMSILAVFMFIAATNVSAEKYNCSEKSTPSYQDPLCESDATTKVIEFDRTSGRLKKKELRGKKRDDAQKPKLYYVPGKSQVVEVKPKK